MANNVNLPAQGVGDTTPRVETYQIGPGSSQRQGVAVLGGVIVPAVATASQVTTGGTAVLVVSGPINGGYLTNPYNATAQGIGSVENLYVDPVSTTPGSTDAAGNGTTTILQPGQSYTIPPMASGSHLYANAATSSHKFTVVVW